MSHIYFRRYVISIWRNFSGKDTSWIRYFFHIYIYNISIVHKKIIFELFYLVFVPFNLVLVFKVKINSILQYISVSSHSSSIIYIWSTWSLSEGRKREEGGKKRELTCANITTMRIAVIYLFECPVIKFLFVCHIYMYDKNNRK